MNKPLKDWTLGEIKEYCKSYVKDCETCIFSRPDGVCRVKQLNSCFSDEWDLSEPSRWTEQDKEDAKMIKRVFNGVQIGVARDTLSQLRTIAKDGFPSEYINSNMFSSLKPGEGATLDEIIGGAE